MKTFKATLNQAFTACHLMHADGITVTAVQPAIGGVVIHLTNNTTVFTTVPADHEYTFKNGKTEVMNAVHQKPAVVEVFLMTPMVEMPQRKGAA
jgi:hypothetical protein